LGGRNLLEELTASPRISITRPSFLTLDTTELRTCRLSTQRNKKMNMPCRQWLDLLSLLGAGSDWFMHT